ncbi:MAG: M6 family metalloprotease domain-containing protein [candidate division WOR-3 bacterium]
MTLIAPCRRTTALSFLGTGFLDLLFVLLLSPRVMAMPPMPGVEKGVQFPGKVERPERLPLPTDRARELLVILIDFNDNIHTYSNSDFENLLFSSNTGSMSDYYAEVSYRSLSLRGEVRGWYRMKENYRYYLGDSFGIYGDFPHNTQGLVVDLVKMVDPEIDFARYDGDGDGFVDGLLIVHSGPGAEETRNPAHIWSHKWQLSDPVFGSPGPVQTADGVSVDVFSVQPERFTDNRLITIGVFCHEFGHILGLPDLYDTDYSSAGLGGFCLMAGGSWGRAKESDPYGSSPVHPCAWAKYLLGWTIPDSVEVGVIDSVSARLVAVAADGGSFRILKNKNGVDWSPSSPGSGEYFLVENRQRIGFDLGLPGSGLLILHIDESQPNNDNERHPLVGILRADGSGSYALGPNERGSDAHLWKNSTTGVRNFTTPSTAFYDGVQTGVVIEKISPADSVMSAVLKIEPLFLGKVYSFPNPVVVGSENSQATIVYTPTDSVRLAGKYPRFRVRIFNLAGEPVRVLDKESDEINLEHRAAYWRDLKNEKGKPVTSGMYFYIVEIDEENIKEKNVGRLTIVR